MIERLLPFFTTLLARTLRVTWVGDRIPERAIIMFWHGKMFAGWYSMRRSKPIALVSRSKDGRFLAAVLRSWGYKLARGSSNKDGMAALEDAMNHIQTGEANTVVITPDGPRGPQHRFKRGAFIAARNLGLPLYMLEIEYSSRKVLRSWDSFEVPFPFSRVTISARRVQTPTMPDSNDIPREWLEQVSLSFDHAIH